MAVLMSAHSDANTGLGPPEMPPITAVVANAGAMIGMIQIVSISDNPPSVTLRYKIIQQPGTK
jgi:hypothetical protein